MKNVRIAVCLMVGVLLKKIIFALVIFMGCLVPTGEVRAYSIVDVDPGDLNALWPIDESPGVLFVAESYGETSLIPYESHDGYAVVSADGGSDGSVFFDKVVTYEEVEFLLGSLMEFDVWNEGPYFWSDYHFEFWDADFTTRLDLTPVVAAWDNYIFGSSAMTPVGLHFWSPEILAYDDLQPPGAGNFILIDFAPLIDGPPELETGSFGLRQIATASPPSTVIPEPVTLGCMFLGIGGLASYVRKRRQG